MLTVTSHTVELINDDFGILSGDRFEFYLDLEVPDDDELYSEKGVQVKIIYLVEENDQKIIKYDLFEKETGSYLDFELEDEELAVLEAYCKEHLPEDE
ncbi:DUF6509 family protein [Peribacillus alkalitolerans]|uniref:DUF6509 family protein n=1 Tax=Peribacillus alkalitolerans TaxID=1550385 RepID=UPI0013D881CD|nr:DUF6509 family protein [Peribacillus alkalitolerans]